jgi:predicted DNA-binding transcriptional regulator YafY
VKTWRLEAVADCRRDRNSSFEYPNRYRHQPDRHFEDSFGIWQDHREPEEVEIRVTGELRDYVAGTVWHQSEHKTLEVGAVRVRFRLAINPEVERWLLSLGKHVEILKPDDLRAAIAEHHREAAARAGHT